MKYIKKILNHESQITIKDHHIVRFNNLSI